MITISLGLEDVGVRLGGLRSYGGYHRFLDKRHRPSGQFSFPETYLLLAIAVALLAVEPDRPINLQTSIYIGLPCFIH